MKVPVDAGLDRYLLAEKTSSYVNLMRNKYIPSAFKNAPVNLDRWVMQKMLPGLSSYLFFFFFFKDGGKSVVFLSS